MSPPTLPTGTVSSDGRGARTYPRSPGGTGSPGRDDQAAASPPASAAADRTGPSVPDARSTSPTVEALRRRNDTLERRLTERDLELQRVIDHYERLLEKRSRERTAREREASGACARLAAAVDAVTDAVARFVGR